MNNKKLINNLYTFIIRGGGIALTFAVSIVLARIYGADLSGEYYISYNFRALVQSLILMGYSYVIVHFCAPFYKEGQNEKGNVMLSYSIYGLLGIGTLSTILILGGNTFVADILYGDAELGEAVIISALMFIPASIITFLAEIFKALGKVNVSIIVSNIIVYFFFIVIILSGKQQNINEVLYMELLAYCLSIVVVIVLNIKVFRRFGLRIIAPWKIATLIKNNIEYKTLIRKFTKENWILTAISVSNVILTVYDTLVIGALLSVAEAALFSVANKVTAIGSVCLTTINAIVGYQFATAAGDKDKRKLDNIMIYYTRILMLLAVIFLLGVMICAPIVPWIYGNEYFACTSYIRYLAIGQFILIATGPSAYFLIMTGYAKNYRKIVIVSAVITLVTSYLGARFLGVEGVIFSNVLVVSIKNIWSFIVVLKTRSLKLTDFLIKSKGEDL